jgi:hypothetical protein
MISDSGGNTPTTIPNLGLWLKADAGVTLVGGEVDVWADQSGNGRDFSAPALANRPAYSGTLNGLPVLTFDGSTDHLTGNAASLTIARNVSGVTIIAVVKYATGGADQRLFSTSTGASTTNVRNLISSMSSIYRTSGRRLDADSAQNIDTVTTVTGNPAIQSAVFRYSVATAGSGVNSVMVDGVFQTPGNSSDTDSQRTAIGVALSLTGQFLNGDLAELIIYQRAISVEERNSVERYLSVKWGIAI